MNQVAHNAYLNTRVTLKASALLEREELRRLTQLDLSEIGQRFGLGSILEEEGSVRAKTRAVEQALIQVLLAELGVLIRPMNDQERGLVLAWARKYALFNLKTLLRGKIRQLDQQEIRDNLYDLPPRVRLANEDLFRTETAVELLRCLEDGPLSLLARQAREAYERRHEAFALEAAIDQRYYTELARRVTRLDSSQLQREMKPLVGCLVDRADLLWLLRFRFAYQLSPSETFYQLVPSPHLMHRRQLLDIVALDDQPKVLAALPDALRTLLGDVDNLMEIQRRLGHFCSDIAAERLRNSQSGAVRALAYLILREADLRGIFTLIQGRLLRLSSDYVELAMGLVPAVCVHQWKVAA